ncbi:multidrug efflux system membrane fusion protein [Stella humosa]|uniref:Multidrug efflux system membrane fusion protein n=1 Tax=Stella humosa TaxID=94 RepID=A0A3N1KXJ8_9PROT|nr:efflux RND transporter periplasmic adaptor subunit [Stella humosa]ROP83499.1 multidrug efflux system membrane fusion protein [Stella humosa]BBK33228.1 transporter [Stella humosa]
MRRVVRWLVWLVVLGAIIGGIAWVLMGQQPPATSQRGGRGGFQGGGGQPTPVLAVPAATADVPIRLDAVGTIQPMNTVTVRPQVDGQLIWIGFKEGQDVRKGDLLAQIDPAIYKAALDQAEAKKAQDQANLTNARLDLERYVRLSRTDYATKQQADTQRALVQQLEALLRADQAAIDNAKTQLSYATITAPIDGRTGLRLVDEGNLVGQSTTTGIVVITQVQPIAAIFTLPQQFLNQVNAAMAAGAVPAEAIAPDNRTVLGTGVLEVVDNQVDPTTGTIKMKATFANADRKLWPGQFVNIRLQVGVRRGAVVVPSAAVQRGPNGTIVYLVQEGDTVALKPVTVVQQSETQAVIGEGLAAGERVVTSGFSRLMNGSKVQVSAPGPNPTSGPPAATGEGRRGPGANREGRGAGRGERPAGERPAGERPAGERPAGERPAGERQQGARPQGEASAPRPAQ